MAFSARQSIEFFHLVFLRALSSGPDKSHFVLKGGCNLRFFYGSPRYSEDIDFDVFISAQTTVKNKINRLLSSPWVTKPLATRGLSILDISTPKQTNTTQRWKVGLQLENIAFPLRTKLEFSRRGPQREYEVKAVNSELSKVYALQAPVVAHYGLKNAIVQKLEALLGRKATQARDIFDLALLAQKTPPTFRLKGFDLRNLQQHVVSLSYTHYQSQVIAYLDPEEAPLYESEAAWQQVQTEVLQQLKRWLV